MANNGIMCQSQRKSEIPAKESGQAFSTHETTVKMGGGNAQKSAMSRQKNAEKAAAGANAGGGKAGIDKRATSDMGSAMAAAQAERAAVKAAREAKAAKKK